MGRSRGTITPHGETGHIAKNPVTWFLVADGAGAQVYVRRRIKTRIPKGNRHYEEKYEEELVPVAGMTWRAHSSEEYEMGGDVLGRVFQSVGSAHHMIEPKTDIRKELKLRFMRSIAETLQEAHRKKSFHRLVLIAPPKLLGELKKQLDGSILALVVAELPKEVTHFSGQRLAAQLEEII